MQAKGNSYYVQLWDGDVHRVTLDQLDDGFQAGHIDENTMVLADGATRWVRLGQLAGIDDDVPVEIETFEAPRPRAAVTYSRAMMTATPVFPSHRPVSIDLSEVNQFRQGSSGKRWFAALVGLAVVGGLGTAALKRPSWAQPYLSRLGLHTLSTKASAMAVAPPAATVPPFLPPAPATTAAPPPAPPTSTSAARVVTPQPAFPKPHAPASGSVRPSSPNKIRSAPFTTGGSKFDPLSSSI